jgi:hypothetical protein
MLIVFTIYVGIVLYLALSHFGRRHSIDPSDGSTTVLYFCDMAISNHLEALYFSLSTMATIGYVVSDYFFGGCWTPFVLELSQVCCAISTCNAIAASILFLRISRGHKRVKSILFSNHFVIQKVNGTRYLMFRVAELRRHPLFEASVCAYCIRTVRQPMLGTAHDDEGNNNNRARIQTTHFVTKPVPLAAA